VAFDTKHDARRLTWALLVASLACLTVLGVAAYEGLCAPWQRAPRPGKTRPNTLVEIVTCDGTVDRCFTCHEDVHAASSGRTEPDLDRDSRGARRRSWSAGHAGLALGCSTCHGGVGRALAVDAAHTLLGTARRDPLLARPYAAASCTRCHVAGAVSGGAAAARGAELFLSLGCAVCHSPAAEGRGGFDVGPDLHRAARRDLAELRLILREPSRRGADSRMPAFAASFAGDDDPALADLLTYVIGLSLPPSCPLPTSVARLVAAPCTTCHADVQGRASGRFVHRCVYLNDRRAALACAGCHAGALPAPLQGECPVIRTQRSACAACHRDDA